MMSGVETGSALCKTSTLTPGTISPVPQLNFSMLLVDDFCYQKRMASGVRQMTYA